MKAVTKAKLESIFQYPWFQSCGGKLPESVGRCVTWKSAAKQCCTRKWENCRLFARNTLDRFLQMHFWDRAQEWNPITDELRPAIAEFVENSLTSSSVPSDVLELIKGDISWDIMFICLETEYQDLRKPIFYLPTLDIWYAAGHFPCGWEGEEFPERWDGVIREGRLIVY